MSMRSSIARRLWLFSLAAPLWSGRLDAQRLVIPALPAPATAKEALYGSISPDGRSFVYEVVEGDERLLWKLDLETLRGERVTPAPGVRHYPMWAPDGKQLAYWRSHPLNRRKDGGEGLYVLDADTWVERRLVPSDSIDEDANFSGEVTWLTDGSILYRHVLERPGFNAWELRTELIAVRADGSAAKKPSAWLRGRNHDLIAPSGRRSASVDSCCGGARQSIWVRSPSGTRCVVGPLVPADAEPAFVWTRDEKRLYLVSRAVGGEDTLVHAFAIDLERARGWRIGPRDGQVSSVSVTDAGDVALTLMPTHGRIGSLWTIPASRLRDPEPGATQLQRCPPLNRQIDNFVRSAKLPTVHWVEPRYEDAAHRLTVFIVTYGEANEIYPTRMGLRYGSRIGWIGGAEMFRPNPEDSKTRVAVPFPLHSSDAFLLSDSLADRLKSLWDVNESWRNFLLGDRATPFELIIREVRRDPHRFAIDALANPTVAFSDTIPFSLRLELAALEDTLAAAMIQLPSVRMDPEKLALIMNIPMYRSGDGLAALRATQQLQALMPSLVGRADRLSEGAALQVYFAEEAAVSWDSLRMTMLRSLTADRSRVILALAAEREWTPRPASADFARSKLTELHTIPERELAEAIRRVRIDELPGNLPAFILSSLMHAPWSALDEISRLDERFRPVRARATLRLALEPTTPDSVIELLTEGLSRHPDPFLAQQLLQRPRSDTSRALLRAVSHLESIMYGVTAKQARERLAILEPSGPPSGADRYSPPPPPPPPPPTPTAPAPTWYAESGQRDQCLLPDAWSEELRGVLGEGAQLLSGDTLCIRATAALDRAFALPAARDSAYIFAVTDGFAMAFPPSRPDADVTLVRFDSAFIERSRRTVKIH